ncbi:MAG: hypothetical protein ACN6RK_11475 [Stenotrophomonas sp.]
MSNDDRKAPPANAGEPATKPLQLTRFLLERTAALESEQLLIIQGEGRSGKTGPLFLRGGRRL